MNNPWLYRCTVLLALFALVVITLGAFLTSETRALPGSGTPSAITASAPGLQQAHRVAGYVVAALTMGLAIWSASLVSRLALAMAVVEIFTGAVPILHALVSPVYFALLVATAVLASPGWRKGPKPVPNEWEPIRALGMATPVLIFLQIGLGVAFRHNAMGVIWHILDAMLVLLVVLIAGVFVLRQYPEHPSLRPAALTLVIITGVQVLLGFAAYLILLMSTDNNSALIVTGSLHVANAALTLAAGVVLAMQIHRNLEVTNRSVTAS